MKKILAITTFAAFAYSGVALAEVGSVYGAVDYVKAELKDGNCIGIACGSTAKVGSYRLGLGYKLYNHMDVEANYSKYGKFGQVNPVDMKGYQIGLIGTYPLNDELDLTFKLALASIKASDVYGSFNTNHAVFSLGAKYKLSPSLAVRAQYENLGDVKVYSGDLKAQMTLLSGGIIYSFF